MKILPLEIKKRGCLYKQVKRTSKVALYSLCYEKGKPPIGFDVFRVRISRETTFQGRLYPPSEIFPSDTNYGQYAWSYTTEETANKKYEELNK